MATCHPTAAPGYGKRSAPSQSPSTQHDFSHLPEREAYLAAYIDRLPDGAAIDTKTLAREQPRYGQQAVRSALRKLADLGHLLRIREKAGEGLTRWVSRTYFSRTARPRSWWQRFLADRRTTTGGGSADPAPAPPARSIAYRALASLGAADKRMMLSANECAALESLATEWFARDVTPEQFRFALTNGLPASVQCPGAFARKRLLDRLPPLPEPPPPRPAPLPHHARPPRPAADVHRRAEEVRALIQEHRPPARC
ncbi:hypothetical protein [Kitasatospora sp. NBC_01302]|uniref:hypothetical protein n=1 Tax=Kitasatospora sp. NBC_01302 TaxID=2903575 RepID=UPI002E15BF7F|nr:hypothetical protein OG294_18735 [Kitasatospora sp. NBC_01302]